MDGTNNPERVDDTSLDHINVFPYGGIISPGNLSDARTILLEGADDGRHR